MATQDLTTLASFREYQAVSGAAATALEDRIETLITVASDAIMDYCQQQFAPRSEEHTSELQSQYA